MKKIGIIGGMSWESTAFYYKIINETIRNEMGHPNSAKISLQSVNFETISQLQHKNKWDDLFKIMKEEALNLQDSEADFIVIATNTMHKLFGELKNEISIPILHIADTVSNEIQKKNIKKLALLGTKFTMEQDFYRKKLESNRLEVITPNREQKEIIHQTIYNELCAGIITEESKKRFEDIISYLCEKRGAEGVILGCTEIGMLVKSSHVPLFDTAEIHARYAAQISMLNPESFEKFDFNFEYLKFPHKNL